MDRRAFVAVSLALLAAPLATQGQSLGNGRRVGIIHQGGVYQVVVDGLRQGLRELGLEEGKHIVLDIRDTKTDLNAVDQAAQDLERGKVDLIYTVGTSVTLATKRVTTRTPIVFYAGSDPVAAGLVESLAKPGGRLTGVHGWSTDLTSKRLEMLKEMMPRLHRAVTFYNPGSAVSRESARRGREAGRQLGVTIVERHVRSAEELRLALHALKPREVDAVFFTSDGLVASQAAQVIDAAMIKRLPTIFHASDLVARGALASYGLNYREIGRLSAGYVQRVLAGTLPKDLPVENYDKIELALNLHTAREIGLTIPPEVVALADEVIQ
jgi:putative ABC transport system substrate-binding protein